MGEYKLGTFIHDGCVYEVWQNEPPRPEQDVQFARCCSALQPGQAVTLDPNLRVVQTAARPLAGAVIEEKWNGFSQRYAAETPEAALALKEADHAASKKRHPPVELVCPPVDPETAAELKAELEKMHTGGRTVVLPKATIHSSLLTAELLRDMGVDPATQTPVRVTANGVKLYGWPTLGAGESYAERVVSGDLDWFMDKSAVEAGVSPFVTLAPRDDPDAPHVVEG